MTDQPLAESEIEEGGAEKDSQRLAKIHDRAMRRFDSVAVPQQELRAQSLEARRFVTIPGAMWEGVFGEMWENAPRPEIDKITKSLEKIETDYRQNRLIVDFVPAGDSGDQDTASTLDGVYRADSYYFKAQQARDNAFQEGIRGGFGAYRLTVDYADPDDPDSNDLRINPGMTIVDADQSVYFDGASKLYDKSDAKWAFVIVADPREMAIDRWGADKIADFPLIKWAYQWSWFTPEVVYTAEYYEVEIVADKLLTFTQDASGETQRFFESEIDPSGIRDLKAEGWQMKSKPAKRRRVRKYIMNGSYILKDCGYIAGPNIPIVPFYGRRDFVDNMERWRGHVGKMMDRQRIYNSRVAKLVETDGLAPREVPIFAAQQMPPHLAEMWARQNIDRHPYALVEPLLNPVDGSILAAGPIGKVEPPQMAPVTGTLLQIASSDLTDQDDNADQVKANTSADAMDIAAQRVDLKSAIYLDNERQTTQREGEIYLGMFKEVYAEPGRKVETLSDDGKEGVETIGELHVDDMGVYRIRNDLSQGRYKVIADVQESTSTKRQKTVKQNIMLAEIAGQVGDQELGQAALLNAVMNQDGEGMQDMQRYARNKLISLGVVEPTPEEQQKIDQAMSAQQPDPQQQALLGVAQAQAQELASKAKVNEASAVDKLASAQLKGAQAEAVGGPVSEPDTPSGLDNPESVERIASAQLKTAQAERLHEEAETQRIRRGHEIDIENRQQDLAERQPQKAA